MSDALYVGLWILGCLVAWCILALLPAVALCKAAARPTPQGPLLDDIWDGYMRDEEAS